MTSPKTGILLLNLGGPDCLESVKPFLFNLFADPDIIKLPFSSIFQKPLAWYISTKREHEAQINYAYMGGSSPILQYTQAQGEALKAELCARGHGELPVYIAMRYWKPLTGDALDQIMRDKVERLIVVPLYPHFSYTTTGSSLNELKRVIDERRLLLDFVVAPPYYQHPLYQQALADCLEQGLRQNEWTCPREEVQILFSAHSLPLKHVKKTKDPYPQQIEACAQTLMETYFPKNPWELSYQSQVGDMPWLGPRVDGVLHYFAGKNQDNILVVPLSFVSDHVETLVEIDRMYLPLAKELQIEHCYRAPSLNTNPIFIRALAELVAIELDKGEVPNQLSNFKALIQAQAAS